jgi:hypothetical protein
MTKQPSPLRRRMIDDMNFRSMKRLAGGINQELTIYFAGEAPPFKMIGSKNATVPHQVGMIRFKSSNDRRLSCACLRSAAQLQLRH